jgi:hypothetical protein
LFIDKALKKRAEKEELEEDKIINEIKKVRFEENTQKENENPSVSRIKFHPV